MMAGVGVSLLSAIGASARVFELMDREPELPSAGSRRPFDGVRAISAELRGVHFSFPSRPDVWRASSAALRCALLRTSRSPPPGSFLH